MRFRLAVRRPVLFGLLLVIALIAALPMRLALSLFALDAAGLSVRDATGSVWWGTLKQPSFGGAPLGDVTAGLAPADLLVGRARLWVKQPGADGLKGAIVVSRHSAGIDDVTARLDTAALFAPLPVARLELTGATARFVDNACAHAAGQVRAVLAADLPGLSLPAAMSGTARCDGDALLVPLTGEGGADSVALRLWASGRYRAELRLQPSDPAGVTAATALGFQPLPGGGYQLAIEGRF
jgi:general secretion pathway protein N